MDLEKYRPCKSSGNVPALCEQSVFFVIVRLEVFRVLFFAASALSVTSSFTFDISLYLDAMSPRTEVTFLALARRIILEL